MPAVYAGRPDLERKFKDNLCVFQIQKEASYLISPQLYEAACVLTSTTRMKVKASLTPQNMDQ